MLGTLSKIGMTILLSLLTEKVMKKLVILILERLSKKTDNTVDDELVVIVKEALK